MRPLAVGDTVRVQIVGAERRYLHPFADNLGEIVAIESDGVIYPYEVKFDDGSEGVFDAKELKHA